MGCFDAHNLYCEKISQALRRHVRPRPQHHFCYHFNILSFWWVCFWVSLRRPHLRDLTFEDGGAGGVVSHQGIWITSKIKSKRRMPAKPHNTPRPANRRVGPMTVYEDQESLPLHRITAAITIKKTESTKVTNRLSISPLYPTVATPATRPGPVALVVCPVTFHCERRKAPSVRPGARIALLSRRVLLQRRRGVLPRPSGRPGTQQADPARNRVPFE